MGLRFEQDSRKDCGICALGQWNLSNFELQNGNRPQPLQDPETIYRQCLGREIFSYLQLYFFLHDLI